VAKKIALLFVIVYTIVLTILSFADSTSIPSIGSEFDDKIYHFLAYLCFTLISYNYIKRTTVSHKYVVIICCLLSYGIVIEVLQGSLSNTRISDFFDVVANSIGIVFGIIVLIITKQVKLK
jgi:VanZ family protein